MSDGLMMVLITLLMAWAAPLVLEWLILLFILSVIVVMAMTIWEGLKREKKHRNKS